MISLTLAIFLAMAQKEPVHDVVARVAGHTITRQDIDSRFSIQDPAARHDWEQARLDQLMAQHLFEAAVERAGVRATDEELERDPRMRSITDENIAAMVEADRQWMRAALAVFDGESPRTVYARMIDRKTAADRGGEERLQRFVLMFDSRDAVLKSLERIDAGVTREQLKADIRFRLSRGRLLDYLTSAAKDAGVSREQFAETFWSQIIRETGTAIIDQQYRLISWRELSWDVPNTTTR